MLVHIGLWKIKQDTSEKELLDIFSMLATFPQRVPGVLSVNYGKNEHFSWEGKGMLQHHHETSRHNSGDYSHGFNYGFSMLMKDRDARVAYDNDPLHVEIANMIIKVLDGGLEKGIIQFDFEC